MVHGECGGGAFSYGTPVIATVDGVQRGPRDVEVHVYLKLRLTPRMNARARRGNQQEISVFISENRPVFSPRWPEIGGGRAVDTER